MTPDLILIAKAAANKHGIPLGLVKALCQQESGNNPWATRYEPAFLKRYVHAKPERFGPISVETERQLRATSFGLMQIMGQVAREQGYQGVFLTELCDPAMGLEYSCRLLGKLLKKYAVVDDAIASYNAGSPRKNGDGVYVNQEYVTSVKTKWAKYG